MADGLTRKKRKENQEEIKKNSSRNVQVRPLLEGSHQVLG